MGRDPHPCQRATEPRTAAERRRDSDARMRRAGYVRVSAWISPEQARDLAALFERWSFKDRSQLLMVAISHLAAQSDTMTAIEV